MVIKILPTQIPQLWEIIKFAVTRADEVESKDLQPYFNELLHALLSDKAQCFVRLDDNRILLLLMITRISVDKITGRKSLFIQALYSWKNVEDKEWQDDYNFVKEFAKHEQCKLISFESRNLRIWQLGETLGFKESLRTFRLSLGGV